ncbi:MAG TPA: TonB-dependent receptor plug domain-containing protein, partial [Novosphingobium sp.]|nr:TonB-dependent receptor plug domain-containing protein [Novosphingobium sp.]
MATVLAQASAAQAQVAPAAQVPAAQLPAAGAPAADMPAASDIIVTAERRSVNLQKAALSISALTGDSLQVKGATSVADAIKATPSVVIQQSTGGYSAATIIGGGGPPNMSIRGLGTDGFNKQPSVRVYQ